MSNTIYDSSLPILRSMLSNLDRCLAKAEAHAAQRGYAPDVLITARLAPDMFPFAAQVKIACDAARMGVARLGSLPMPPFTMELDTSFAQLRPRIAQALEYLDGVPADALQDAEDREITFTIPLSGKQCTLKGGAFLREWVLPNFFFHVTTAYNLLRHNGVDLGKADYIGRG